MPQTTEATPTGGLKVYSNGRLTARFQTDLELTNLIADAAKALNYRVLARLHDEKD